MMDLPDSVAIEFDQEMFHYEQEQHMPYVTSVERHGIEKGKIESKIEGKIEGKIELLESQLTHKFGAAASPYFSSIRKMIDPKALASLGNAISVASSIEELKPYLP